MNKNLILSADVLDIIFEGRNKAYGAYDLRKTYNNRVATALAATIAISTFLLMTVFAKHENKDSLSKIKLIDINISELAKEPVKKIVIPPPAVPKPQAVKVELKKFTPPEIVVDKLVTEPPPTVKELEGSKISDINKAGEKIGDDIVAPSTESKGTGPVNAIKKEVDWEGEFFTVQMEAEFPGGKAAWSKFLERNLNSSLPTESGAPTGKYTVNVSFLVDKSGTVSEVVALNDPGFNTAEEAVRVIKKCPLWTPALQNGNKVTYRVRQSITFMVID